MVKVGFILTAELATLNEAREWLKANSNFPRDKCRVPKKQ
jgi:hypothetical protein